MYYPKAAAWTAEHGSTATRIDRIIASLDETDPHKGSVATMLRQADWGGVKTISPYTKAVRRDSIACDSTNSYKPMPGKPAPTKSVPAHDRPLGMAVCPLHAIDDCEAC